jgi:hypothetical protein
MPTALKPVPTGYREGFLLRSPYLDKAEYRIKPGQQDIWLNMGNRVNLFYFHLHGLFEIRLNACSVQELEAIQTLCRCSTACFICRRTRRPRLVSIDPDSFFRLKRLWARPISILEFVWSGCHTCPSRRSNHDRNRTSSFATESFFYSSLAL